MFSGSRFDQNHTGVASVQDQSKARSGALVFGIAVVVAAYGLGCARQPAQAPTPAQSGVVRATPTELFVGDLKRLEPHLGLASGCVRLDFDGPERVITIEPEVWQGGSKQPSSHGSTSWKQGPVEASISLKRVIGPDGKAQYEIVDVLSGQSGRVTSMSFRTTVDIPAVEGRAHTFAKTLHGPTELPEGQKVPVWAHLVYGPVDPPHPPKDVAEGTFEEAAKGALWAVILRVSWERRVERE
jgi:hypothetical protein